MSDIFISYRHGSRSVDRIYGSLLRYYGKLQVFRDNNSIPPGTEFPEWLAQEIRRCTVVVLLVDQYWIQTADRLRERNDWVTEEIRLAFHFRKIVMPVLVAVSWAEFREEIKNTPFEVMLANIQTLEITLSDYGVSSLATKLSKVVTPIPDTDKIEISNSTTAEETSVHPLMSMLKAILKVLFRE